MTADLERFLRRTGGPLTWAILSICRHERGWLIYDSRAVCYRYYCPQCGAHATWFHIGRTPLPESPELVWE